MDAQEIAARLTKAQRAQLLRIAESEGETAPCCLHYRPFMKLWARELVTRGNERWMGDVFVVTGLGRAVAAALRTGEPDRSDGE
jgi:hypothetical protein